MTSLRKTIDEHEKAMLEQVLKVQQEQKKKLENYTTPLKYELQNSKMQKATFDMLLAMRNYTKLLQTKKRFNNYVDIRNETLKSLQMPIRTEYFLKGIDQAQILEQQIGQCGRYVEVPSYSNPKLEKLIADDRTKGELNLNGLLMIDSDMKILADALRKGTVRRHFFKLTVFLEQVKAKMKTEMRLWVRIMSTSN
jgi:hypothetical protein